MTDDFGEMSNTGDVSELLLTTPKGHVKSVRLEGGPLILGRSPECQLSFPEDDGLSREHLLFERQGDRWATIDRGSKNGTFVNGTRIKDRCILRHRDRISASCISITFIDRRLDEGTLRFETPAGGELALSPDSTSLKEVLHLEAPADRLPDTKDHGRPSAVWAFARAGRELAIRRPLPELFRVVLDLSMEAVGAEHGVLLSLDEADRLVLQASSGGEFRISATVRDKVLRDRSSVLIADLAQYDRLAVAETTALQSVRSLMAVPLQTDDRVLGLLYVDSSRADRRFTKDDLNLLTAMANVAGMRIERERWEMQRRVLLSENVATLRRLAAALSHELNTPLGAVKSAVDSLLLAAAKQTTSAPDERPRLAALQSQLLGVLDASLGRMKDVISRIQRFTNLDRAEEQSVNLNELLTDAVQLADAASESVEVKLDTATLPALTCRPQHLSIVFSTLLRHAIEACKQTTRGARQIKLSTRDSGARIEVQIEDNGRGISPDELAHIFEPGFHEAQGRISTCNWSLFGARQMVRGEGGEICVSSDTGKGTTIVVSLPKRAS